MRTNATETDVAAVLVLILVRTRAVTQVSRNVFPAAALHDLTLQDVRVVFLGVVLEIRVQVVGVGVRRSIVCRRSPFCHVAGHVEQTEVVRTELSHLHSGGTGVVVVSATVRLEVRQEATLGVAGIVAAPRISCQFATATSSILPLGLGRQTIDLRVDARTGQVVGTPAAEGLSLLPSHTHYRIVGETAVREILQQHRVVVRVLEVTHPHHRIGIDIDDGVGQQVRGLAKRTHDRGVVDGITLVHPESVHTSLSAFGIATLSHVKLVLR